MYISGIELGQQATSFLPLFDYRQASGRVSTSWTRSRRGVVGAFVRRPSFFSLRAGAEPAAGPLFFVLIRWIGIRLVRRFQSVLRQAHRPRSCVGPLIKFRTPLKGRSWCCGSKVPGGPLNSDKFEREAHKEIAELKARSRIRQLEAETRELQQNQPTPTGDMTTKQL